MSVANGINRVEGEALMALRRCFANVVTALRVLTRPARMRAPQVWPLTLRESAIAGGVCVGVLLLLMFTVDAAATRGVSHVPRWIIEIFDVITDFGKSGWFLWPLGILFLALAACPPALTPFSQRVLATIMVRVGFLVYSDNCTKSVCDNHQAHDRARSANGRGQPRPVFV